jgi:hypothetical protein
MRSILGGAVLAAMVLLAGDAGARPRQAQGVLTRIAPQGDAVGRVHVRTVRHGRQSLDLRVRRLDPQSIFGVRTAGSGTTLGDLPTNPRGDGRLRLRPSRRGPAGPPFAGQTLEVVDPDGNVVLQGEVPDPGADAPREAQFGFAFVQGVGIQGYVSLQSNPRKGRERITVEVRGSADAGAPALFLADGDGVLQDMGAFLCGDDGQNDGENESESGDDRDDQDDAAGSDLTANGGDGEQDDADDGDEDDANGQDGDDEDGGDDGMDDGGCSWSADTGRGDPLPFGVLTVGELAGRAFEIRDGAGNVLLAGEIPELRSRGDDDGEADDQDDEAAGDDDQEGDDGEDDAAGDD